jgi:hypothetical protein
MRLLDTKRINALRNHRLPLPLLQAEVTALPLDEVGGCVGVEPEGEGC